MTRIAWILLTTVSWLSVPSFAATVLKWDLGESGGGSTADILFSGPQLSTADDGELATLGQQNSSLVLLDFLVGAAPDIPAGASMTLSQITVAGPAEEMNSVIFQNTLGGFFAIYDDANQLLLAGALNSGVILGGVGSSTGSFLSTSPIQFTDGLLLPWLDPHSGSLGMSLSEITVDGSTGLSIVDGSLIPFNASANGQIGATLAVAVPEPSLWASLVITAFGCLWWQRRKVVEGLPAKSY